LPYGTGGGATPLLESLPSIQSLTRFEDQEVLFISVCKQKADFIDFFCQYEFATAASLLCVESVAEAMIL